jgi:hypothetical protein
MLTLHQSLPASFATNPDAKRVPFSPNDTPEAVKENVFATVGLHPALKLAVRITNTEPLVPLGSIDTDSVITSLDIWLMETREKIKWRNMQQAACNVVVDCSGGTIELFRSMRGTHELKQAHRLVADQTALTISFKPPELPPSVFIVNHGVNGRVFELEPHKTVGDLQACCADTFNVPIDSQARSAWLSLGAHGCLTLHPAPSPLTPHSRRFSPAARTQALLARLKVSRERSFPPAACVSMTRAGRSARSTSCTSSCGPEAAPSS